MKTLALLLAAAVIALGLPACATTSKKDACCASKKDACCATDKTCPPSHTHHHKKKSS